MMTEFLQKLLRDKKITPLEFKELKAFELRESGITKRVGYRVLLNSLRDTRRKNNETLGALGFKRVKSQDGLAFVRERDAQVDEETKGSADCMKQEAEKFLDVAQRHLKGDLLRQVSTLAQAVTFDLDPKHYVEKDLQELEQCGETWWLSSLDATDHYTKAHLARDLARVVCAAYPETVESFHALQRQACEGDPPPFFLCTNKNNKGVVDHASLAESADFQAALRNLFTPTIAGSEEHTQAYHRQRWALLKARGITTQQEDLEILGRVLSCFGFKQERKRQRTDEGLKSAYVLSMRSVVDQQDLAVASVRRFKDRKPWRQDKDGLAFFVRERASDGAK